MFDYVPHGALLPGAKLTICHAGLGTVHASLAHGVPLVCIPDGRDQKDNAARVVALGAGVRVRRKASPGAIRKVVTGALRKESLYATAGSLARTFAAEDGAAGVADELEALASE